MLKLDIFIGTSPLSYWTLTLIQPPIIAFLSHLVKQVIKQKNAWHLHLNENDKFNDHNILVHMWNLKTQILC